MSLGAKVALGLAITVALGIVLSATAAATATYRAGMLSVTVQEKSDHGVAISFGLPMILMQAGMVFVPEEAWADARRESERWWPLIEAGIAGIEDAPDGTYVAVDNARETVRISKEHGRLVIHVDDTDATVHLAIPVRSFHSIARHLGPGHGKARPGRQAAPLV